MLEIVKNRYRLVCYRNEGGRYFIHDRHTNKRVSLETDDKDRANELLVAHNEAAREPAFNLQKARVYLAAADAEISKRTWRVALKALIESKKAGSANRERWETFAKNKGTRSPRTTYADLSASCCFR